MPDIWSPYPKLEKEVPYQISQQDGKFCVVKKSDGKVVKCHPTEKLAKLHLTALYANEPSTSKKSVGYGMLKSLIEERVEEIKAAEPINPEAAVSQREIRVRGVAERAANREKRSTELKLRRGTR